MYFSGTLGICVLAVLVTSAAGCDESICDMKYACDDDGFAAMEYNSMISEQVLNISIMNSQQIQKIHEGLASVAETQYSFKESFQMVHNSLAEILEIVEDLVKLHNESEFSSDMDDASRLFLDGVQWTRFWWYDGTTGYEWPAGETDVLGASFGTCQSDSYYCFGRLPAALREDESELLAIDSIGATYRWKFNPNNPTAHAVWNAFYHHRRQRIRNDQPWNPKVIRGNGPVAIQDSFMYREQNGVWSVLLDDDNCDCKSTLSMGHGMCRNDFSSNYGPSRFGVDVLDELICTTPSPLNGLTLYFRDDGYRIGDARCP